MVYLVLKMFYTTALHSKLFERLQYLFMINDLIRLVNCIIEFKLNILFVIGMIYFICDLNDLTLVK